MIKKKLKIKIRNFLNFSLYKLQRPKKYNNIFKNHQIKFIFIFKRISQNKRSRK